MYVAEKTSTSRRRKTAKKITSKQRGIAAMNSYRRTSTDFLFARPSFVSGVGRLVDFGCLFDQYNGSRTPIEADVRAAVSDWLSVGDDIQSAIDAGIDDDECAAQNSHTMASREERLARRVEKRIVQQTMQAFSGPLPPPAMLAEYNTIVPKGAERILVMAEKQQEHRHGIETRVIRSNTLDQRLGLILGFIVMMSVAAAGVWCVSIGKDTAGLTALIGATAAPVAAFIYGRKKQSDERKDKS
jgi:uncharacterized membrane protein